MTNTKTKPRGKRRIELTLEATYQPEWGLWEAYRDLVANAVDAEVEHGAEMHVSYSVKESAVIVRSKGVKLDLENLLIGRSSKRGNDKLIGQFGEGLDMSFLAIARLADQGYSVDVVNGDEKWTVCIEQSHNFNAQVLVVYVTPLRKDHGHYQINFRGVTHGMYGDWKSLMLKTDPEYDEEFVVKPSAYSYDRLLLAEQYAGRIYCKGVYVTTKPTLKYGYDLDIELNRDRHMMDEWRLQSSLHTLLSNAMVAEPKKFGSVFLDIVKGGEGIESDAIAGWTYETTAKAALNKVFDDEHGEGAVAVSNMAEAMAVGEEGKKAVVVSEGLKRLLATIRTDPLEVLAKKKASAKTTYSWDALTEKEQASFTKVCTLFPHHEVAELVQVVDFHGSDMRGRCTSDGRIHIARSEVADVRSLARVVGHELAHLKVMDHGPEFEEEFALILVDAMLTLAGGK